MSSRDMPTMLCMHYALQLWRSHLSTEQRYEKEILTPIQGTTVGPEVRESSARLNPGLLIMQRSHILLYSPFVRPIQSWKYTRSFNRMTLLAAPRWLTSMQLDKETVHFPGSGIQATHMAMTPSGCKDAGHTLYAEKNSIDSSTAPLS